MYRSRWGNKFYFPAERDVFVYFAPVANADGSSTVSPTGKIKVRTWYTKQPKQDNIDDVLYTLVAPRPVGTPQVQIDQDLELGHPDSEIMNGQTSETKNGEIDDNSNQLKYNTSVKVTWDGKDVPDGPWLD